MRQSKRTFGVKIAITTGVLTSFLVLMAWYGIHSIGTINSSFEGTADKTTPKAILISELSQGSTDMVAGQDELMIYAFSKDTGRQAAARDLFQNGFTRLQAAATAIQPLLVTEEGRRTVDDLQSRLSQWRPAYDELARLVDAGDINRAVALLSERITPQFRGFSEDRDRLVVLIGQVLESDKRTVQSEYASAHWIMILLIFGGIGAALAALIVARSVTRELRRVATELLAGSRQVASASGQVASASQSLAQGTSEQAATLEETSSSTSEITSITRKNSENTRAVTGLMDQTVRLVEGANRNLEEMVQSMKEINGSSERISRIIKVIDEIAFQTNILALNAAVEAARAGEAGMGFAVVADEVRNLAQRSAQAAKDTASLIEESIGKSGQGSKKLDQVAQSIREITASAAQVKILVDEVDTGSQEQARGIEQIALAVGQMEQVTQRGAANAEESAAASEELAAQAQGLHAIVERLRGLVGGTSEGGFPAPPHAVAASVRRTSLPAPLPAVPRKSSRAVEPSAGGPAWAANRGAFPLDDRESDF